MNLTFTSLENKILLEIAIKPRSIKFLYWEYVDKEQCSRAGLYKALTSLKAKGVIKENRELGIGIVKLNRQWINEGYDFFRKLLPFYKESLETIPFTGLA
jgi:hypothetical protein